MARTNNLGTTFVILFIVGTFMLLLSNIASDIGENDKLDSKSTQLLIDISNEYESNYNEESFLTQTESTRTNDSTFEGIDAFYRATAEDKVEIESKDTTLKKLGNLPSLFIKIFGVENNVILISFNILIISLITLLIGLQIYKAIRTGEVD